MRLTIKDFKGIFPKIGPELLPFNQSQTAENCNLESGHIIPWFEVAVEYHSLITIDDTITIYLYEGSYWFLFSAEVNLVKGPVAADTANKVYYTGDGIPKKTNESEATTGGLNFGPYPRNFYPLALPSPKDAMTAAKGAGGAGDTTDVAYVWTVLSSWNEESLPSPASNIVDPMEGQTVNLTNITMIWEASTAYSVGDFVYPTADEGGDYIYKCVVAGTSAVSEPTWRELIDADQTDGGVTWRCYENNITHKNIYRAATGGATVTYQYLAQIASTATTYNDTFDLADTGADIVTEEYDPPPDGLSGLAYMGNGILLGFVGKDLYVCEPYKPWAWPTGYVETLADTIVSIAGVGAYLSSDSPEIAVVTTTERPYLVIGNTPGSLSVVPLPADYACVSSKGTVRWKDGLVYPSKVGLAIVNSSGAVANLTKNHLSAYQWLDGYAPSSMVSEIHGSRYFGFWYESGSVNGCIIMDLETGDFTTLDLYSQAVYNYPPTDILYYAITNEWDTDAYSLEEWDTPEAYSTSGKADQYDLTGGTGSMANVDDPDVPRNIVLTITDANASLTVLQVTVTGTLADGTASQTEVFTATAAGSHDGEKCFSSIDSITVDSITGADAGDTVDIGWGNYLGFSIGSAWVDDPTATINGVYVDPSTGSYNADDTGLEFPFVPDGELSYKLLLEKS